MSSGNSSQENVQPVSDNQWAKRSKNIFGEEDDVKGANVPIKSSVRCVRPRRAQPNEKYVNTLCSSSCTTPQNEFQESKKKENKKKVDIVSMSFIESGRFKPVPPNFSVSPQLEQSSNKKSNAKTKTNNGSGNLNTGANNNNTNSNNNNNRNNGGNNWRGNKNRRNRGGYRNKNRRRNKYRDGKKKSRRNHRPFQNEQNESKKEISEQTKRRQDSANRWHEILCNVAKKENKPMPSKKNNKHEQRNFHNNNNVMNNNGNIMNPNNGNIMNPNNLNGNNIGGNGNFHNNKMRNIGQVPNHHLNNQNNHPLNNYAAQNPPPHYFGHHMPPGGPMFFPGNLPFQQPMQPPYGPYGMPPLPHHQMMPHPHAPPPIPHPQHMNTMPQPHQATQQNSQSNQTNLSNNNKSPNKKTQQQQPSTQTTQPSSGGASTKSNPTNNNNKSSPSNMNKNSHQPSSSSSNKSNHKNKNSKKKNKKNNMNNLTSNSSSNNNNNTNSTNPNSSSKKQKDNINKKNKKGDPAAHHPQKESQDVRKRPPGFENVDPKNSKKNSKTNDNNANTKNPNSSTNVNTNTHPMQNPATTNSSSTNNTNNATATSTTNATPFHQQKQQNPNQAPPNMQQFQQPIQQQMWNFLQQHPHHPLAQNPFAGQPPPPNHPGVFGMMNGGFGQNPQHPGQNQAGMMMNFMGDQNHGMPGMHQQSQMQMQMVPPMDENMSYVDYYQTENGEMYYTFSPAGNHQQQIHYDPNIIQEFDSSQSSSSVQLQTTAGSGGEITNTTQMLSMDSTGLVFPVSSDAYAVQNQTSEMSQQNVVANGQMMATMGGAQGFIPTPMVDQIQFMQQQAFNPAMQQQAFNPAMQQQVLDQQVLDPTMQQQVLDPTMQQQVLDPAMQQQAVLGTTGGQNFFMYPQNVDVTQPVIDLTQQQHPQEGQNFLNAEQSAEQTNPDGADSTTMHFNLNPQDMQLTGLQSSGNANQQTQRNQNNPQNPHPGGVYPNSGGHPHHPAHHQSQQQQHYVAAAAYHQQIHGTHPNQQQAGQHHHSHPHQNTHPFNMAAHQLNTSAEPFIPQDHSTGYVPMEMDPNYGPMMYLQPQNPQNQVMGYPGQNLSESNIVEKIPSLQLISGAIQDKNSNAPNNVFDSSQPYGLQNSSEQSHNQINSNFGNHPHSNSYGHHHQTNSSSHNATTPIPGSGTTPIPDPPTSQMPPRSTPNSYGNPQSVKFQSYANVTSSGLKPRPSKNFNDNFNQSSMKPSAGRPANYPASDEATLRQVLSDTCGLSREQAERIAVNLREKGANAEVLEGWYRVFIDIRKNTDDAFKFMMEFGIRGETHNRFAELFDLFSKQLKLRPQEAFKLTQTNWEEENPKIFADNLRNWFNFFEKKNLKKEELKRFTLQFKSFDNEKFNHFKNLFKIFSVEIRLPCTQAIRQCEGCLKKPDITSETILETFNKYIQKNQTRKQALVNMKKELALVR